MAVWNNRIIGTDIKPASTFLANEANWRIHPRNQQDALLGSLSEVGWITDVVVNLRSDPSWGADQHVETLIDGHLRVTLALREGDDTPVPVKMVDLLPSEERLILASLDPIAALAVADKEKLDALLRETKPEDAALQQFLSELAVKEGLYAGTGGGTLEDAPEPQIDRAAELQEHWQTALGQLWEIPSLTVPGKNHRVFCGDNTRKESIALLMQGRLADCVFTDPPYDVAGKNDGFASSVSPAMADLMASSWDVCVDLGPALSILENILAEACTVYVCASHHTAPQIWTWMAQWATHHEWCVWSKPNPMPSLSMRHWTWSAELICYATRGHHIFNFPDTGHALSVWEIAKNPSGALHPTRKPVELPAHAISHSSHPGALIVDNYLGSGSTMVACEQGHRICYGCDIEPKYIAVTLQRLQDSGLTPRLVAS